MGRLRTLIPIARACSIASPKLSLRHECWASHDSEAKQQLRGVRLTTGRMLERANGEETTPECIYTYIYTHIYQHRVHTPSRTRALREARASPMQSLNASVKSEACAE